MRTIFYPVPCYRVPYGVAPCTTSTLSHMEAFLVVLFFLHWRRFRSSYAGLYVKGGIARYSAVHCSDQLCLRGFLLLDW